MMIPKSALRFKLNPKNIICSSGLFSRAIEENSRNLTEAGIA